MKACHTPIYSDKRPSGFTIVELLIVIVVIGILAAVTVSAYNGVQQRARNLQNTELAKAFGDALTNYLQINGSYPPGMTNGYFCLGSGKPDANSDGQYDCVYKGSSASQTRNTTFNNAMKPYVNVDMQAADFSDVDINGTNLRGAQIWYDTSAVLDGKPYPWLLFYVLDNQGTCTYGKLLSDTGWPNLSSTRPVEGYTYQDPVGRGCLIALPNPNTL